MAKSKKHIKSVALKIKINDRLAIYEVDNAGLVRRISEEDVDGYEAIVSLTDDDYFMKVDRAYPDKKAFELLNEKTKAPLNGRLINHSKEGYLYSTTALIGKNISTQNVYPLTELSIKSSYDGGSFFNVRGFSFGDKNELLVLLSYKDDGDPSVFIMTDVDDVDKEVRDFAISLGLSDGYQVTIFSYQQFFETLNNNATYYPVIKKIYGVEEDVLWGVVSIISIVMISCMTIFYFYQQQTINSLKSESKKIKDETYSISANTSDYVAAHIPDLINLASVDSDSFFKNAESLWIDESYLNSEASNINEIHIVHLPLDANSYTTHSDIKSFYTIETPANCSLVNTNVGANLNEITAKFDCKNPNHNSNLFSL